MTLTEYIKKRRQEIDAEYNLSLECAEKRNEPTTIIKIRRLDSYLELEYLERALLTKEVDSL